MIDKLVYLFAIQELVLAILFIGVVFKSVRMYQGGIPVVRRIAKGRIALGLGIIFRGMALSSALFDFGSEALIILFWEIGQFCLLLGWVWVVRLNVNSVQAEDIRVEG